MSIVDDLWKIFNDFKVPEGKICVPLSGGLDSRVLAGIISGRRKIDYGFCWVTDKTSYNKAEVNKLMRYLNYDNFDMIYLIKHEEQNMIRAVEILPKRYLDSTIIIAKHMDVVTGLCKTNKRNRRYYYSDFKIVENGMGYADKFNYVSTPFWRPELVGYLHSLSYKQRFFQRAYRDMIKKYLPELWKVPRCFETGEPVSLNWYIPKRIWRKL